MNCKIVSCPLSLVKYLVFSVFLFCCLSLKAVFDMAGREGKFTWNL